MPAAPASDAASGPPDFPPLTPAQRRRILHSPIHRHIKHYTYGVLAIGVLVPAINLVGIILAAVWARAILKANRWLIFHVVASSTLQSLWAVYSGVFFRDVKFLAWPDQLQIDIGWMMFADGFSICFLSYIFYKMRTYGVLDIFDNACSSGCHTKLNFVKIAPLVSAILALSLGLVQLLLAILLYRNPIINPPLDAHGMPVPQDPETGAPLPLGPDGRPVVPAWMNSNSGANDDADFDEQDRSVKSSLPSGGRPPSYRPVGQDELSGSDGEEDEKKLLRAGLGDGGAGVMGELGKKRSGSRRKSGRSRRRSGH
ncbi:hypothetical protein JCM8097_002701 [Rhodosporidiobolus ruineniae]